MELAAVLWIGVLVVVVLVLEGRITRLEAKVRVLEAQNMTSTTWNDSTFTAKWSESRAEPDIKSGGGLGPSGPWS